MKYLVFSLVLSLLYSSLLVGLVFVCVLLICAPWSLSIYDFLLNPAFEVFLPLLIIQLLVLWHKTTNTRSLQTLSCIAASPGLVAIFLARRWPEVGYPTSWEDSYQALVILQAFIRVICWPVWFVTVLIVLFYWDVRQRRPPLT